jgi:nitroimidazol reductase NimA-like FMN-containing flavoprotein (pyridoxamine 5'-phosphate oxidase superfamily)
MTEDEIASFLAEPLMCVFSVSRPDKGPIAVPLAFLYRDGKFLMQTSAATVHGKAATRAGRATVTIHHEHYRGTRARERYVMAEGPVAFQGAEDRDALLRTILAKDRGEEHADAWLADFLPQVQGQELLVLEPAAISGFEWDTSLDQPGERSG